ncbi:MAG: hypothetical protein WA802_08230 [Terracidiphilus sp.]
MRSFQTSAVLACILAIPSTVFADFSYQQTTQITGGSMLSMIKMAGALSSQARKAGEPVVTSVYLKGNRLANVSPESVEIIDLDQETITHIDVAKRTYTVMTFQQMRDQMARAQEQMEKQQAAHPASTPPPNPNADNVKMSFDVHVRKTGTVRQVSGLSTSEAILTMMMNATDQTSKQTGTMAITNDMWVVPEIPGYAQMRDFYMRMASKMGTMPAQIGMDFSKMLAQNPGASQGLADMAKEMQKIQGVPVMQVMRMGTTTDGKPLPAASEAPLPPDSSPAMPSGGDIAKQSAASVFTSHLPFGGFGKKKQDDPPPPSQNSNAPPPTSAVLMESQTTTSNFSSDPIDPSHFEVPASYKLIQTPMNRQ